MLALALTLAWLAPAVAAEPDWRSCEVDLGDADARVSAIGLGGLSHRDFHQGPGRVELSYPDGAVGVLTVEREGYVPAMLRVPDACGTTVRWQRATRKRACIRLPTRRLSAKRSTWAGDSWRPSC